MTTAWIDRVKESGQLTVFLGETVTGQWASVMSEAIRDFNALSRIKGLGVTLVTASEAPAARGGGGADVAVALGSGNITASYEGTVTTGNFDGSTMHGQTLQYKIDNRIEKAFVFLPAAPLINTPRGRRPVGPGVMKVIAIHEFVHACGLSNAEHSTDDLFQGFPQVDPGDNAAGDRVRIQSGRSMTWMPPLVMAANTVRRIKSVW